MCYETAVDGYFCPECKTHFSKPQTVTETHGFSEPPYEEILVCPYCGETGFLEACECEKCGDWTTTDQACYGMCEKCEDETLERFKEMLARFSDNELRFLDACFDGYPLSDFQTVKRVFL